MGTRAALACALRSSPARDTPRCSLGTGAISYISAAGALEAPIGSVTGAADTDLVPLADLASNSQLPRNGLWASDSCNRGAGIRTRDLGHPKAARYQAAPRPDVRPLKTT